MLARLPAFAGNVVLLDGQQEEISHQSAEGPAPISVPEN